MSGLGAEHGKTAVAKDIDPLRDLNEGAELVEASRGDLRVFFRP